MIQNDDTDRVDQLARDIVNSWYQREEGERHARALVLARRQIDAEATRDRDADPGAWADRMARAHVTSVALTWPGAPVPPDACLPIRRLGFSIDETGVHFTPEDATTRSFVCSPVVALGHDEGRGGMARFSIRAGRKWTEVAVPKPERRDTPSNYWARTVLEALARAGVTFGPPLDLGTREAPDLVPAHEFAAWWLLGVFQGALRESPVRHLSGAPEPPGQDSTTEEKQLLGQALARHRPAG